MGRLAEAMKLVLKGSSGASQAREEPCRPLSEGGGRETDSIDAADVVAWKGMQGLGGGGVPVGETDSADAAGVVAWKVMPGMSTVGPPLVLCWHLETPLTAVQEVAEEPGPVVVVVCMGGPFPARMKRCVGVRGIVCHWFLALVAVYHRGLVVLVACIGSLASHHAGLALC